MGYTRVLEAQRKPRDGALDLGPGYSRLVLRLMQEPADAFLRRRTERDEGANVVGIMGLSMNPTPHRLSVDGVPLWSWCDVATLVLPTLLRQTATIESPSPVSGESIRLTVTPGRVEAVSTVEATRNTSCNHIYIFASREEGERWASGRDDIEIGSIGGGPRPSGSACRTWSPSRDRRGEPS